MNTPLRDRAATPLVGWVAVVNLAAAPGRPFLRGTGVRLRPGVRWLA